MGLRNLIKSSLGIYSTNAGTEAYGLLSRIFPGGMGEPPLVDDLAILKAYTRSPWLRSVAHRVAFQAASVDWQLYVVKKGGKAQPAKRIQRAQTHAARHKLLNEVRDTGELELLDDHPLLDLLQEPNPYLTGLTVRFLDQLYYDLLGEVFWVKERNGSGMPVHLWPVPAHWVRQTPTPSDPVYKISFRGWQGEIPETEMLWLADPNPENPYGRGRGLAYAAADDIETDQYAAKRNKAYFYNGARPDFIVSFPDSGATSPEERKRLEQDWLDKNQGFFKAYKPFFINRKVDVHQVSGDFDGAGTMELRKSIRDLARQVWGVPPEILGLNDNSNRATITAADFIMAQYVTLPRLEVKRNFYQQRLVPEFDERLILDYVSPVQEDDDFKLEVAKIAPWSRTVDEWRAMQKLPPLEFGGDILVLPNKATAVLPEDLGKAALAPPAPAPALPPGGDAADDAVKLWLERAMAARGQG